MSGNEWKQISDDAKDLVRRMLVFDPAERITCEDILAHKWLELDDSVTGELTSTSDSSTLPKTDTINKHAISSSSSSSSQNLVGSHSSPVQGRPSIHLSQALHLLSSHVGERRVARLATRLSRLISTLASANHSKSSLAQFIRPNIKVDPADPQTQQLFSMKQRRLNRALNYQPEELLGIQHATHFMKILTKVFDECGPVKGKLSLSMFGYLWTHFITNLHTSDTENLTDDVYADEEKKNGDNIQSEGESTTNAAQTSTKTEGLSDITELTMKNSTILQTPTHKPQRHSDNKLAPTPVITYSLDDPSVHTNTDSPTQQAESSGALKYPLVLMCKFMDRDRDGLISLDDLFTVQVSRLTIPNTPAHLVDIALHCSIKT